MIDYKVWYIYHEESAGSGLYPIMRKIILWENLYQRPGYEISKAKLTKQINDEDTLSFTISSSHALFDKITPYNGYVGVTKNTDWYFLGRVTNTELNIRKEKKVTCAGGLALLKESLYSRYMPKYVNTHNSYTAKFGLNDTVEEMVTRILDIHNAQVNLLQHAGGWASGQFPCISLGECTATENPYGVNLKKTSDSGTQEEGLYITRDTTSLTTPFDWLTSELVDKCSANLLLRIVERTEEEDPGKLLLSLYLDVYGPYLPLADQEKDQSIRFTKNLLDASLKTDYSSVYSVLLPTGESNSYVGKVLGSGSNVTYDYSDDLQLDLEKDTAEEYSAAYMDAVTEAGDVLSDEGKTIVDTASNADGVIVYKVYENRNDVEVIRMLAVYCMASVNYNSETHQLPMSQSETTKASDVERVAWFVNSDGTVVTSGSDVYSQADESDIIYPSYNDGTLMNCCVQRKLVDGSLVVHSGRNLSGLFRIVADSNLSPTYIASTDGNSWSKAYNVLTPRSTTVEPFTVNLSADQYIIEYNISTAECPDWFLHKPFEVMNVSNEGASSNYFEMNRPRGYIIRALSGGSLSSEINSNIHVKFEAPFLIWEEGLAKMGRRVGYKNWSSASLKQLREYAPAYLKKMIYECESIEVTAADLANLNDNTNYIQVGKRYKVICDTISKQGWYPCLSSEEQLGDPTSTKYTFTYRYYPFTKSVRALAMQTSKNSFTRPVRQITTVNGVEVADET